MYNGHNIVHTVCIQDTQACICKHEISSSQIIIKIKRKLIQHGTTICIWGFSKATILQKVTFIYI